MIRGPWEAGQTPEAPAPSRPLLLPARLIKQPARPGAEFPVLREDRPSQEASPTQKQQTARELRVELQEDSNKGLGESGARGLVLSPGVHVVPGARQKTRLRRTVPPSPRQGLGLPCGLHAPPCPRRPPLPDPRTSSLPSALQPAGCRVQSRRASGSAPTALSLQGILGVCSRVCPGALQTLLAEASWLGASVTGCTAGSASRPRLA